MANQSISVIIPTFNRASVLARAIDSVLNQTFRPIELIIVDDGSSDETESLVAKYENPLIQYIKTENRGVSAARNTGIKKSAGDWIALLDSDDEWLSERLERQITLLNDEPKLRFVHGEEIWIRRGKRVNQKKIHQKFGGFIFERCLPLCLISPSASLIEKSLLFEMGGFDEEYIVCEDYDLWLKITSLYPVGFIKEPIIVKHGGHEDQLSGQYKAMDYWRVRSMDRILEIRDLDTSQIPVVKSEILRKCEILRMGYLKHENLENLTFIESLLEKHS